MSKFDENNFENYFKENIELLQNKVIAPSVDRNRSQKTKFSIKKTLLLVSIISVISVAMGISAYAIKITVFDKNKTDIGLQKADNKGLVQQLDVTAESNGVKVTVQGALSDGLRTIIKIRASGKNVNGDQPTFTNVKLINSDGIEYEPKELGMGMKSIDYSAITFADVKVKETEENFTLKIGLVNDISGNWVLSFPLKTLKAEDIKLNKEYKYGNQQKIIVKDYSASVSATKLTIDCYFADSLEPFNLKAPITYFNLVINGMPFPSLTSNSELKSTFRSYTIYFEPYSIDFQKDKLVLQLLEENDKKICDLDLSK